MKPQTQSVLRALKYGEIVIFELEKDKYFVAIGGAGKDPDGNYRSSGLQYTKEKALQKIGACVGYTQEKIIEIIESSTYIDSFAWAITNPIPSGTEVYIKENAKEVK